MIQIYFNQYCRVPITEKKKQCKYYSQNLIVIHEVSINKKSNVLHFIYLQQSRYFDIKNTLHIPNLFIDH